MSTRRSVFPTRLLELGVLSTFSVAGTACGRTALGLEPCNSDADCQNGYWCVSSGATNICVATSSGSSSGSPSSSGAVSSSSSGVYVGSSATSSGHIGSSSGSAGSSGSVGSSGSTSNSSSSGTVHDASSGSASSSGSSVAGVPGCSGSTCEFIGSRVHPAGAGIALEDSCYQSSLGVGGYAYPLADTGGSTACVVATQLCGIGTTAALGSASQAWGSGIGLNVGQPPSLGVNAVVTPTASGLTYAVNALPANGLRIVLGSAKDNVCYQIPQGGGPSGTIAWSAFVTDCWDSPPDGLVFSPADGIADVQFVVPATSVPSDWDFCISSLSF